MKYIRTKDTVLSCSRNMQDFEATLTDQKGWIKNKEIVMQADTIEKICDEFVVEYDAGDKIDHLSYYSKDRMNFIWEGKEDRILTIYGAIWTDKGLIYVAKIKERKKLELL